jgi:hypothetical protein
LEIAMRKTLITVACLVLAAFAAETRADDPKQSGACKMDMAPMQEQMKRMRGQMDKIRATPDAREKERLMEEHYKSMQQSMSMMQGMMGGGMMHGKKGAGSGPKPAN